MSRPLRFPQFTSHSQEALSGTLKILLDQADTFLCSTGRNIFPLNSVPDIRKTYNALFLNHLKRVFVLLEVGKGHKVQDVLQPVKKLLLTLSSLTGISFITPIPWWIPDRSRVIIWKLNTQLVSCDLTKRRQILLTKIPIKFVSIASSIIIHAIFM